MGTGNLRDKEITVAKRYIIQKDIGLYKKEIWKSSIFWAEIILVFLTIFSICDICTTAFGIKFNNAILYGAILFYCIWFTYYFLNDTLMKKRWIFFSILWFGFIGILIFSWNPVIGGSAELINQIVDRINKTYNGSIGYIETVNGSVTYVLCILFFFISWFITKGIVERRDSHHLLFIVFPFLLCSFLSGGTINGETMFLLFICIQLVIVITSLRKRTKFWGGEGTKEFILNKIADGKIRFKMLIVTGNLVILLSFVSFYFLGKQIEEPIDKLSGNTVTVKAKGLRFLQDILPKISGGKLSFSIDGVGGGVSGGILGELEGTYYGQEETLKITCTELPQETLYLKGFVGTTYTKNRWIERDEEQFLNAISGWETSDDPELYIQNLPFLRMMYAMNSEDWNGEKYEPAYITIEYMGENRSYTYVPYRTYLDEYYSISSGDGAIDVQTQYDNIFPLFQNSQYDEVMEEWLKKDDLHGVLDKVEEAYEYYVSAQDTKIGDVDLSRLKELCAEKKKEWDEQFKTGMTDEQIEDLTKEKYEDVKNFVRRTLLENCKFEDKATKLPEGKDFIDYFMFERKKGDSTAFASTAVMMFRMCGIPARYVEGYVVPTNIFSNTSEGKYTAVLQDDNAHAWVEIYVPGKGFTCVETTPGFDGTISNLEMPEDEEEEETTIPKEEKEDINKEDKKDVLQNISEAVSKRFLQIIVVVLLLVIFLIIRYIWTYRQRRGLIKGYTDKERIKLIFYNFYELLVFGGFDGNIDVTKKEFVVSIADNYEETKEDTLNNYMKIVLNAHYGFNEVRENEVEFSREIYEKMSLEVYRKISLRKKCIFKLWKAF